MPKYARIDQDKRYHIYELLKNGKSNKKIAQTVNVHPSTISRELRRNTGQKGYRPHQANEKAKERMAWRLLPRRWNSEIEAQVIQRIQRDHSPEQISERMKLELKLFISRDRIYQFLQQDMKKGGELYKHLRCQRKRKKRFPSQSRRGTIKNASSIEDRPLSAENRRQKGHWERDLVIGKNHQGALLTMVDRKCRFTIIAKVASKKCDDVGRATIEALLDKHVCSITNDNGLEFANHEHVSEALNAPVFFCHPYSSYERGTNENTNGLIRQYFPKKTNLKAVTQESLIEVQDRLNSRPRKVLGWRTPYEVMHGLPIQK